MPAGPPDLNAIRSAREAIASSAIRTPLVRLQAPGEIYLKLENLQPIGSFKIRGAANAIAHMSADQLRQGVVTASAGNMAQGVAWRAQELGIPCTVIAPETAPETKIRAIERLGGRVLKVPYEAWWRAFEERGYPGVQGAFVHAFDDPNVLAGNGTIGLEILEDLPEVSAVVIPWGGGGLACGIASAIRALKPSVKIFAAEVSSAAPLSVSWNAGSPQIIEPERSFVDGIGGKSVFPQMFELAKRLLDGVLVASPAEVADALRLMAERNRIIAEGAGAAPVACALKNPPDGKVACIVSGGNIDLSKLAEIFGTK
ncbi:MAG TPA: threonine/serine dehydratase [Bryobacteraceae bacterium]|nr:threonine/serine dehydratase [Bryobacteraceae bacterium]